MTRAGYCACMSFALLLLSAGWASAEPVFCDAGLYIRPTDTNPLQQPVALYGLTLNGANPMHVAAILALETGNGWFQASLPETDLSQVTRHFLRGGRPYTTTAYDSPVMYLRFPSPVQLINAFLLGINGQACPPLPRPTNGYFSIQPNPIIAPDPRYPDPTRATPPSGAPVIIPKKTAPLFKTDCAEPFRGASVTREVPPDYPEDARMHGSRGTTSILVTINQDGSVAKAELFASAGDFRLDRAALKAAVESGYQSAVAYCQPVPGRYIFKVTFA